MQVLEAAAREILVKGIGWKLRVAALVAAAWCTVANVFRPELSAADIAGYVERQVSNLFDVNASLGAHQLGVVEQLLKRHPRSGVVVCLLAPVIALAVREWDSLIGVVWLCGLGAAVCGLGWLAVMVYGLALSAVLAGCLVAERRELHRLHGQMLMSFESLVIALWPLAWPFLQISRWREAASYSVTIAAERARNGEPPTGARMLPEIYGARSLDRHVEPYEPDELGIRRSPALRQ